jgi:ribosome-binding protein aMBF1 (putative translation factor)
VPKRPMSAHEEKRYEEFRHMLVEEREKAGLSQVELGARLIPPRPQSYIGKIELGTRRLDALEYWDLARAVGFNPCDLLKRLEASTVKRTHTISSPTANTRRKNSRK